MFVLLKMPTTSINAMMNWVMSRYWVKRLIIMALFLSNASRILRIVSISDCEKALG